MHSTSKRIGIGLIGTGAIAAEHAMAISQLASECVLVAACDTNPARLLRFGETYFFPHALGTPQELISHPQVDLVVIATPPSTHEDLVTAAIEAGKHVICEKPLAHSLDAAEKIVAAGAGDRVSVSYQLRYVPEFERVRFFLSHPEAGKITRVSCRRVTPVPKGAITNGWWGKWNVAGGGTVMTQFIHHLDFFCYLWGQPSWVKANASCSTPGLESEDTCQMHIGFQNSIEADCFCSILGDSSANHFEVEGEFGLLSVPWTKSRVNNSHQHILNAALNQYPIAQIKQASLPVRALRKILRKLGLANWSTPIPERSHTPYYHEVLACMRQGKPLPISPLDALPSMKLVAAIYESARSGLRVQVDSVGAN